VTADRERWNIVLEPLPDEVPAAARLRSFLKRALRSFRLRCVSVAPVPPSPADPAGRATDQENPRP
jgi:hypothetical protein